MRFWRRNENLRRGYGMREVSTTVGRGQVQHSGRKYMGQYYVNAPKGLIAHSSTHCQYKNDSTGYRRLPVYEEGGKLWWHVDKEDYRGQTELCHSCPDPQIMSKDWVDKAACFGVQEFRFVGSGRGKHHEVLALIEEYCNRCPVELECLEYGASMHLANAGAIWGGIFFQQPHNQRVEAIEKRRKELQHANNKGTKSKESSREVA